MPPSGRENSQFDPQLLRQPCGNEFIGAADIVFQLLLLQR